MSDLSKDYQIHAFNPLFKFLFALVAFKTWQNYSNQKSLMKNSCFFFFVHFFFILKKGILIAKKIVQV